ncbi:uncharacterized abhydrolase domain-containing protein DDB_G0269086-like [Dermacentor silvarum]|uniref:uncharacterized abhydrolase domain-containing protein DDB_G0269086-like n=1 Tax=Dermacentor silvarum TaxID=543639 RepID=UPI0021016F40|nr:uncharacterized abhydrolase domain-containing protein DDB_G0269086-like [Dermacentor silvarum]
MPDLKPTIEETPATTATKDLEPTVEKTTATTATKHLEPTVEESTTASEDLEPTVEESTTASEDLVPTVLESTTTMDTKKNKNQPFLFCMVGDSLTEDSFPPDGLCNVLIFGTLLIKVGNQQAATYFEAGGLSLAFELFLKALASGTYQRTETGLTFDST